MERKSHLRVLLGSGGCQQQAARSQQTAPSKCQSLLARGEEELGGILGTLPVPPAHQLSQGYPGIPAAALHLHRIAGSPPKNNPGTGSWEEHQQLPSGPDMPDRLTSVLYLIQTSSSLS